MSTSYKEIVTDKGILKYRMPDALESFDLLDASGVNDGVVKILHLKRNMIAAMENLIDYSELEGINTYKDLLIDIDISLRCLSQIADEVIEKTFEAFKKKT